jgi:hypothetical protein
MRLSILAFVAGCATSSKGSGAEGGKTSADYAPYAVGASWTYAVNYLGQTSERTIAITKEDAGYFVDDQQGRFRHTEEGLRDPQRFLIRHPLEEGNTWKAIVSATAIEHYRITGVGEPCESRAGRFEDCLTVESRLRRDDKVTLLARWAWARGVGLVKIETEAEIDGKRVPQTEQSLIHFSLSPSPKKAEDAPKKAEDAPKEAEDAPDTWAR